MPLWFRLAYTGFVLVLVPVYAYQYPLVNFLWFSNLALLGGLIAAWLGSAPLASMLLLSILLPELGWITDFIGGLLLGGDPPIGGVAYMFDPTISLWVRGLSLYHLLLPPALLWMVWRGGYWPAALRVWLPTGWTILLISFFTTNPALNVNWVHGPGPIEQVWMPAWAWLVVVMATFAAIWWLTHHILSRVFGGRQDPAGADRHASGCGSARISPSSSD